MEPISVTPKPWFGAERHAALADFWAIYEAHYDEISESTLREAERHPEFGAIVRGMTAEQTGAEQVRGKRMLGDAIHGAWAPYEADLRSQGAIYARLGVSFRGWYDLVSGFQTLLVPLLLREYLPDPPRLAAAMGCMLDFVHRAMSILSEEYLATKEALINEQRELAERRAKELAESEEALRRQTGILESILNCMRDGVVVCDEKGTLVLVNAAGRAISPTAPSGGDVERLSRASPLFRSDGVTPLPFEEVPLLRALRGESVDDLEVVLRSPGMAEGVYLRIDARPLRGNDGNPRGGLATYRDVTAMKRAETSERVAAAMRTRSQELEMQNQRIQEANRLKSEFLANMSHELRTPLNAIIGFTELMHDGKVGPVSDQHKEFLGDILASSRHLLKLINDVLDLAKVESGKFEFRVEPADLSQVVAEVCGVLRATSASSGVGVDVDVARDLGEVVLDAGRLKQVLYNLLSNALKFTSRGGKVVVRALAEGPAHFRLEVEDTGPGIAAADLNRLFVEFQQLGPVAPKRHSGTGLGLALTKRIVEAQGGSVGVRSALGKGSVFHVVLPRRCGNVSKLPLRRSHASRSPNAATVLVVEDNPEDQAVIERALAEAGYAVEMAATGAEAIALCRDRTFDAVTLDLLLPDMSGQDVLAAMRNGDRNRGAPVIVITVVAEPGAVAGFMVSDLMPKPIDAAALLAALRRVGVPPEVTRPVLVVDDDPGTLRLMDAALAQLGYRPICKSSGRAALDIVESLAPAAVVLDLVMPEMDGFEFLERFRGTPRGRETPVIVWTVKDLSADEQARLRRSTQAIVAKGRGPSTLVEELDLLLKAPRR